MKVKLMRKIDYYVGTPICIFFSGIHSVAKIFRKPSKEPIKIKKVLFIQISEMGSAIMTHASITHIKERYPGVQLYYVVFDEMKEGIKLLKIIPEENIITIRGFKSTPVFVKDVFKALHRLRKEKIDVAFDLELFSRASNILSYLSGAKNRVGFDRYTMEGLYRGNFHTHKVQYNQNRHMSLNFLSLVNALDSPEGECPLVKKEFGMTKVKPFKIKSTQEEKNNMFTKLKQLNNKISKKHKIILFNPNASQLIPIRKWPLENYIELAKKVLSDKKNFIVITGVASEKPDAEAICSTVGYERCIDLTGQTKNIRELIDLYNISDIIITNDSGPAHFASTTDIKIIAFYGPETPEVYGPLSNNCAVMYSNFMCSPCVSAYNHRKTPCKDNKCLQAITPDQAYSVFKKMMK
ncbi:MAG: glycosyltransferase family 9 protein [Nanoarchaeota archaeon]|nr:glycosyltransferase family 9 protein [Nanoarchaeota archaeon]